MDDEIKVLCPWCDKGEVYIEAGGKGRVSVMSALQTLFQGAIGTHDR